MPDPLQVERPVREGQKPPPTVGKRYRFTDFVGACWEATFAGHETVQDPDDGTCLRLHFEDHGYVNAKGHRICRPCAAIRRRRRRT